MFSKFRTLGTVEKGWECGKSGYGGSNCPQGVLGFHDLFPRLCFPALLGQVESWRSRDPRMLPPQWEERLCFTGAQTRTLVCLCRGPWKMENLFQICVTSGWFPRRGGDWIHTLSLYQRALGLINEKLVQGSPLWKAPLADGRSKCKYSLWRNIRQSPGIPIDKGLRNRRVYRSEKSNIDLSRVPERDNTENG